MKKDRTYNQWASIRAKLCIRHFKTIGDPTGKTVLCAGCGDGTEMEVWNRNGFNTWGTDLIAKETARTFKSDFLKGIPGTEDYDIVYSSEVLEDLTNVEPYLTDCIRLIKPNGYFIITTDNPLSLRNFFRFFTQNSDFYHHTDHYHFYSPKDLRKVLEKKGLTHIMTKNLGNYHFASLGKVYMIIMKKEESNEPKRRP